MALVKDIKLKAFDLDIQSGDFVIASSTRQHQQHLLLAHKGEYRSAPFLGVGLTDHLLDDEAPDALEAEIRKQFTLDGMKVEDIEIVGIDHLKINAEYE